MYSASKFAIEGLTESLYKELHSTNIKVVLVEPGDFKTGFTEKREICQDLLINQKHLKILCKLLKMMRITVKIQS